MTNEKESQEETFYDEQDMEPVSFGLSAKDRKKLEQQVQYEYKRCKDWIQPFHMQSYKNLKLYLNEKRDPEKVGDPILYTVMNTIHASMYSDIPEIKWGERRGSSRNIAKNLNLLTEFDYEEMEKDILDLDWLFDTCFFGYGLVEFTYFDRKMKTPKPRLVDPFSFLYDPMTPSEIDKGNYVGEEVVLTRRELEDPDGPYENTKKVKGGLDFNELPKQAAKARTEAQGKNEPQEDKGKDMGDNEKIHVVHWRTWFGGKRVLTSWTNDLKRLVRFKELKSNLTWGYIDKKISRTAHQYKGASIPDMVGDKQRMRSEIINLAATVVKSQQYPHYVYNSNLIRNRKDLAFGFNKFTGVPGSPRDAVLPMNQYSPNMQMTNYILQYLDSASQRATASAEMQQGVLAGQERTVGELNLVAQKADTRYSLMMKNLLIGEKKFWKQWYNLYDQHFKDKIDEKTMRISGEFEEEFYTVSRKDFIGDATTHPDVQVNSTVIDEAKKQKKMSKYIQLMNVAGDSPDFDRRMMIKKFADAATIDEKEMEAIFPPTLDELVAERQNIMMQRDEDLPEVLASDNHMVHLRIHRKLAPSALRNVHMMTHLQALIQMKQNPELDPNHEQSMQDQGGLQPGEPGGLGEAGFQAKRSAEMETSGEQTPAQQAKIENEGGYGYSG